MSSRKWIALLALCLAVSLFCLIYPVYVIRPFRHQGAAELKAALVMLRFRPWLMCAASALALLAAIQYWRAKRPWWKRGPVALFAILVLGFTALSRVNIYELMFHPVDRPEFIPAAAMKLDGGEKVLAIREGGEARAYPIRSISYHHVVNDRLGGVPIAATY
jgi:Protein of unknown function (DUF3179)